MRAHHGEFGRRAARAMTPDAPEAPPVSARAGTACRGEIAAMAMAGMMAPGMMLEHLFDQIEGAAE